MSLFSSGRSVLRSMAVGGALVGTLAVASPAQAALGGLPASSFNNRPHLQAVTFNEGPTLQATYRFDRTLATAPAAAAFTIGGYNSNFNVPATAIAIGGANSDLVIANFPNVDDFDVYSYASTAAGAVTGTGVFSQPSLLESVPLTGATGGSGTAGSTIGPDLVSAQRTAQTNEILYTFDQDVAAAPTATQFGYFDEAGTFVPAATAVPDDNEVLATFAASVAPAVYATASGTDTNLATAANDAPGTALASFEGGFVAPPVSSAPIAGAPAILTSQPDLVSTELRVFNGNAVVRYTFDQAVATAVAANFFVQTSGATTFAGTTADIVGSAVDVTFNGTTLFTEHLVHAGSREGAVTGIGAVASNAGGYPIGGNVGAFATGYSTAPDPVAVTRQGANSVQIVLDARTDNAVPAAASFDLISASGQVIAGAAQSTNIDNPLAGPGQPTLTLTFLPGELDAAVSLRMDAGFVNGNLVCCTTAVGQMVDLP